MDDNKVGCFMAYMCAIFFIGGCGSGCSVATKTMQREAIERGYAEWVVENETAVFRWKETASMATNQPED